MYQISTSANLSTGIQKIRMDGDYRVVLDIFEVLNDNELTEDEKMVASLIIFYDGITSISDLYLLGDLSIAIKEMYKFINCGEEESKITRYSPKLIDWKQDESLICSAINNIAGFEIRFVKYLHWWTFLGYYMAIGECPLSHIVAIRYKIAKGKPLDKHEQRFRMENPDYFVWKSDVEEANNLFDEVWNKS